jgi:ribonuclease HII
MLASYLHKNKIEVGCDEAGRGCLAGPVVAAAVILPKNFKHLLLNDSKQLSEKKRDLLRTEIKEHAIAYAIGIVDHKEIDEINILNASILAMHRALDQIKNPFNSILVDGNRFKKYNETEHQCIIKGDGKYLSIAAASILAKTYRDDLMKKLHLEYPQYQWENNKGYPTKSHRAAIKKIGVSQYHRKSFRLLPEQLSLNI